MERVRVCSQASTSFPFHEPARRARNLWATVSRSVVVRVNRENTCLRYSAELRKFERTSAAVLLYESKQAEYVPCVI